jgi:hypothetical protein
MTSTQKAVSCAATFIVAAMIVLPPSVWSDTVGILNSFYTGEKARASEVNDNFDAVTSAVDGNDALIAALEARIEALEALEGVPGPQGEQGPTGDPGLDGNDQTVLHVFDAEGNDIGIYAGVDAQAGISEGPRVVLVYLEEFEATAQFDVINGGLRDAWRPDYYFESTDCTGPAYSVHAGWLFRSNILTPSVYVVTDSAAQVVMAQSRSDLPFVSTEPCVLRDETLSAALVTVIEPVLDLPAPLSVAPGPGAAP